VGSSCHDNDENKFTGFIDTLNPETSVWDSEAGGDLRSEGDCSGGVNCDSSEGGCDP